MWEAGFLKSGFPQFSLVQIFGYPQGAEGTPQTVPSERALLWPVCTFTMLAESRSQKGSSVLKTWGHWCYLLLGAVTQASAQQSPSIITETFFSSLADPSVFSCLLQSRWLLTENNLLTNLSFLSWSSVLQAGQKGIAQMQEMLVAAPDHPWNLAPRVTGRKSTIAAIAAISQILCYQLN